jgi:hypothetical protein
MATQKSWLHAMSIVLTVRRPGTGERQGTGTVAVTITPTQRKKYGNA